MIENAVSKPDKNHTHALGSLYFFASSGSMSHAVDYTSVSPFLLRGSCVGVTVNIPTPLPRMVTQLY